MKPYVERLPVVFYCVLPRGRVYHVRQGDREDKRYGRKTLCGRRITSVRRERFVGYPICIRCRKEAGG
jgi:hypothetical protein